MLVVARFVTGVAAAFTTPARRALQCGGQVRGLVGEHGQPFVEVAVGRRDGDPVVAGKSVLWAVGGVELGNDVGQPAQDQHALFERPQGAGALAGPEALAVFEQQLREGLSSGLADIEHVGVGDTGQRVKPLGTRNLFFADLFLPGASRVSDAGASLSDVPGQEDLGSVGRAAYSEPRPHYLGES
jgi:hypothetical protein